MATGRAVSAVHCLAPPLMTVALSVAVFAVVYEGRDFVASRGGSMGAAMTAGLLWTLAALLTGIASLLLWSWALAAVAGVVTLSLAFVIRASIPWILTRFLGR